MSKRKILAGSTSVILPVVALDTSSTVGAGLGSLVYNSAGLAAKYKRAGASSWTTITLATMTGGTWASGGFVESDSGAVGSYEFCPPDAALAAGATWVIIEIYGATNLLPIRIEIELDAVNYQDGTRAGLAALPNAAADAAGGLPISDAGGKNIDGISMFDPAATGVTTRYIGDPLGGSVEVTDPAEFKATGFATSGQGAAIQAVTDLLNTAEAEPTGVPPVNPTPITKLAWLYRVLRNKLTVTATDKTFFDDAGSADFKKVLADDGSTYTETESEAP